MGNEYIKISILEALRYSSLAHQNGESQEIIDRLHILFINSKTLEIKIPIDSEEAKLILKYNNNVLLQNYITLESLSLAFNRLYFGKNNKELLKKIERYYRKYSENISHNDDNTELKREIILDKEAFNFIKQYSNYSEYEIALAGKNVKTKKLINKNQELKGKSIVE